MRTTLRIDDALLTTYKEIAAKSGKTLGEVIEEALRESLVRRREMEERPQVRLTTVGGTGLLPGVDITDNAALLDLMEESDGSS